MTIRHKINGRSKLKQKYSEVGTISECITYVNMDITSEVLRNRKVDAKKL